MAEPLSHIPLYLRRSQQKEDTGSPFPAQLRAWSRERSPVRPLLSQASETAVEPSYRALFAQLLTGSLAVIGDMLAVPGVLSPNLPVAVQLETCL